MNKNAEAEKPGASLASAFFVSFSGKRLTKENKEEKRMTVNEAINTAELRMSGNSYSSDDKIRWLSSLEVMWNKFLKQLGFEEKEVSINQEEKDQKLMIDVPYDEVYVMWLVMKMHYYNGEIELYNNSAEGFNKMFEEAKRAFIRENKPRKSISFSSFREV